MKIKLLTFGLILGIILVILNSCGENPQAVVIEDKPKDTIKTDEEIVLKIEELDSISVNFSGVKGKYLSEVYNSQSNPTTVNSEYINYFKFYGNYYLRMPYVLNSKPDSLVYGDNSGMGDMFLITKDKQSKLYNFNFYYNKSESNHFGGTSYYGTLSIKNVKLNQDSLSYNFELMSPRIDTLITKLSYNESSNYRTSGPNGGWSSKKISFHSITEISDSAKISIRIYKKKK